MNQQLPKAPRSLICLLILLATAWFLQPSSILAAKALASEALATALSNGTFDQVKQELMMDLYQKQKFDFDEKGMEELGRNLVAQGQMKQGVEVLQLNQMIHLDSPGAANALDDAYRDSGDDISARIYYDMALNLDPENAHAKKATGEQGDAQQLAMGAMGDMEMDPEALQAAMAQAGVEITPEQMQEMQQAMAQMEGYQQDPSAYQAPTQPVSTKQPKKSSAAPEPQHESEFCEVLHRFNAEKKIPNSQVRARVEGNYGAPGDTMRTWNVETTCGEFLVAVPLWADVSPPVMTPTSGDTFEDAMGGTWTFKMGGDGKASDVSYISSDGTVSEMKRLGDPRSYN
jgi:hypothetical protein